MAKGNETVDHLAMPLFKTPAEEYATLSTNAHRLHVNYYIQWRQARKVVET